MSPLQFLFGFSLILSVQANDWACPNATLKQLGNGTGIFPYPGDDYKYKAGAKCNLTISVPSGLYISVYFDIFSQDDKYGVYDDTGTYFYQSENNKTTPPESLTTATNVHIQIFAQNSGQFKIRWYFNNLDISPNARCKNSVDYLKGYVLDLSTMWQCGSTAVITASWDIQLDATAQPSAITIYSNSSTQLTELTSLKTQSTVYWLPGTNVDLYYSIISFSPSSDLYYGESLGTVPLYADSCTFLLFNGTATLNFQQLTFAYYSRIAPHIIVASGDYGYLVTSNYYAMPYPGYFENTLQITTSPEIGVTIRAVNNQNAFNLYCNSNSKDRNLKKGDVFTCHGATFLSVSYYMDNSTTDFGGLLRFDARMSSQRLLSLTFIVFILRLFA